MSSLSSVQHAEDDSVTPSRRNQRRHRSTGYASSGGYARSPSPHGNRYRAPHHHHPFPLAASSSVADLTLLADLVDHRSGWHEEKRMSDEAVEAQCRGKDRAVKAGLREYYANLNYILDGWRAADVIVDSQFPAEVMRRFGTVQEVERALTRAKRHPRASGYGPKGVNVVGRTPSHPQLMHLLASSSPAESPAMTSSDDDDDQRKAYTKRRGPRLNDVESGSSQSPGQQVPPIGTRAANALGFSSLWFRSGGGQSAAPVSPSTGPPKPTAQGRTPSEDESGFDSDSEPEPSHVGPSERQSLLRKDDAKRGRTQRSYGSSAQKMGQGSQDHPNVLVRALTPTGRHALALEGVEGSDEGSLDRRLKHSKHQQEAVAEAKKHAVLGSASSAPDVATNIKADDAASANGDDEEDRDQLADLPGGKRERERQALRKAVPGWEEREEGEERAAQIAINLNLFINVLLLAGKAVAVLSSSSVSLLASLVDSALDLLSTIIIFAASKAVTFKSSESYFKYPRGKKNFEPLGVVIFSVLMIASFCQVLVESVGRLATVLKTGHDPEGGAELPLLGIAFMVATIGIKLVMWLLYRTSRSSGVRAVAQDSQNDVVFNVFSLTFPFLGSWLGLPALDPIGGVVLSLYIISEWLGTLVETTTKLSGARASPAELARVLYLVHRFKAVEYVSACEVYHTGDDLTVEMDIVLPVETPLKGAHDYGEIITYCVETLPAVERVFLHLDYWVKGPPGHLRGPG
ncbi:unnamed protein product [Parajaminaea phylloscopi]